MHKSTFMAVWLLESSGHSSRWSHLRGRTFVWAWGMWWRSVDPRQPAAQDLFTCSAHLTCLSSWVLSNVNPQLSSSSLSLQDHYCLSYIYSLLIGYSYMWYNSIKLQIDNKKSLTCWFWFWILKVSRSHLECNVVVFFIKKLCIIIHILPLYECSISMLLNIWNYEPHALHSF